MTALVLLLFIVMIPIDCKITNFSLHVSYVAFIILSTWLYYYITLQYTIYTMT